MRLDVNKITPLIYRHRNIVIEVNTHQYCLSAREPKALILEAIDLNERGIKPPVRPIMKKTEIEMPSWFLDAMAENQPAFTTFHNFSLSDKRVYVNWVTGARRKATRESRLQQAIEWVAEGKPRNWKYMNKWK